MKSRILVALAAVTLSSGTALAQQQDPSGHEGHHTETAKPAEGAMSLTPGEVRRVDKTTGKITIRHGPIVNLGMPAMSMVFEVSDPTLLNNVKAGDKVQFVADKKSDGTYIVTRITPER